MSPRTRVWKSGLRWVWNASKPLPAGVNGWPRYVEMSGRTWTKAAAEKALENALPKLELAWLTFDREQE